MDPFDYEETGEFGRYGEDYSDPKQFCRHGVFVGNWAGPDYMCGWCESGEEPPPYIPPTHEVVYYGATGARLHSEKGSRSKVWGRKSIAGILRNEQFAGELTGSFSIVLFEHRASGWVAVDRV